MELILNDDFRDMIGLLNDEQVDYLLIGGWAVTFHARYRLTEDIDFWVRPTPENALRVMRALTRFGAPIDSLGVTAADFSQPRYGLQLGRPPVRIDFLTTMKGISFEEAWKNRVVEAFVGITVNVIGRDDLLRNKLEVGRTKDLLDVEAIQKASRRDIDR
ncbi:MAG: nucleotidyltransferase [Phycisphaeraceae bacterium]